MCDVKGAYYALRHVLTLSEHGALFDVVFAMDEAAKEGWIADGGWPTKGDLSVPRQTD